MTQQIRDKKALSEMRKYIKKNYGSNDPATILRCVRYILRTPEGMNVLDWAEKIMARIVKKTL